MRGTLSERFWAKVDRSGDCWLWTSTVSKRGYGLLWAEGGQRLAHRVAWALIRDSVPHGWFVLHRCDTKRCVRPQHLFLGTHQDNMDDMVRKGRHAPFTPRGEAHYVTHLTADDVRAIRAAGITQKALAAQYGVSRRAIGMILSRRNWKHV